MKVATLAPVPAEVKKQKVATKNCARFRIQPVPGVPTLVNVGVEGITRTSANFNAQACDEAAALFNNLARVLRGQPQE